MTLIIQLSLPSIVTHFDFSRMYKNISYDFETFISLERSNMTDINLFSPVHPQCAQCSCNGVYFISALTLLPQYQELWDLLQFWIYSLLCLCRSSKLDISAECFSENFHCLLFFEWYFLKACFLQLRLSTLDSFVLTWMDFYLVWCIANSSWYSIQHVPTLLRSFVYSLLPCQSCLNYTLFEYSSNHICPGKSLIKAQLMEAKFHW